MNNHSFPQNDPGTFPIEIQEEIAACLLTNEEKLKAAVGLVEPKYFDNAPLQDIIRILFNYFEQYRHCPSRDHLQTELDGLKDRQMCGELRTKMLALLYDLAAGSSLDYSSDHLTDFCKYQAIKQSIIDSVDLLQKKKDYEEIGRRFKEATEIGLGKGDLITKNLGNVEAQEIEWLWPHKFPKNKLSLIVGDPGVGKSFFTMMMAACITSGHRWPNPECAVPPPTRGGLAAHG
jgi:hypothetical protein